MELLNKKTKGDINNMKIVSDNYCKNVKRGDNDSINISSMSIKSEVHDKSGIKERESCFKNSFKLLFPTTEGTKVSYIRRRYKTSHDEIKKLLDNYNVEFMKVQGNVDESIIKGFEDNEKTKKKTGAVKTVNQLYSKLWSRTDLPQNFENNYQSWQDKEIWGIFD